MPETNPTAFDNFTHQLEAIKMLSIKKLLDTEAEAKDIERHSRVVMKCIDLQSKLIARKDKALADDMPLGVDIIWEVMLEVPKLKALLLSEEVRRQIIEGLQRRLLDTAEDDELLTSPGP